MVFIWSFVFLLFFSYAFFPLLIFWYTFFPLAFFPKFVAQRAFRQHFVLDILETALEPITRKTTDNTRAHRAQQYTLYLILCYVLVEYGDQHTWYIILLYAVSRWRLITRSDGLGESDMDNRTQRQKKKKTIATVIDSKWAHRNVYDNNFAEARVPWRRQKAHGSRKNDNNFTTLSLDRSPRPNGVCGEDFSPTEKHQFFCRETPGKNVLVKFFGTIVIVVVPTKKHVDDNYNVVQ